MYTIKDKIFDVLQIIKLKMDNNSINIRKKIGINCSDFEIYGIREMQFRRILSLLRNKKVVGSINYNEDGVFKIAKDKFTHYSVHPEKYKGDYTFFVNKKFLLEYDINNW